MLLIYFGSFFHLNHFTCSRRSLCPIFLKILSKLARRMLSKTCANLIEFVQKIIFSQDFVNRNRKHSSDFTRDRKLPFSALILYFCNFIKSSYQPELNKFWKILSGTVVARHVVSKAALCKARKKLEHEAFVELNTETVTYFNEHCSPLTWNGFFLKAVDGSTVKLPDFPEIAEHFGAWHPRLEEPVPMARISQLFDPLIQNNASCPYRAQKLRGKGAGGHAFPASERKGSGLAGSRLSRILAFQVDSFS